MTPAAKPEKKKSRPKRKWLKRFGWILAGLLLVLVVFHQAILMALVRFAAARFAASQHLSLQYDVEGRALSGLTFTNVRISPTGRSPVDKISIGEIRATYSFMDLLKHGRLNFLKTLEVTNATLDFKDLNDAESQKPKPNQLGSDLHSWLFPPVIFAGSVDVRNLDIVTRSPDGDFVLESGSLHFERGKPGSLKIGLMKIPNLKVWKNVGGSVTVTDKDLTLENLRISPDITIEKLMSSPAAGSGKISRLAVQGEVFGGRLSAEYTDTPRGNTFDADVRVSADKIRFRRPWEISRFPRPDERRIRPHRCAMQRQCRHAFFLDREFHGHHHFARHGRPGKS